MKKWISSGMNDTSHLHLQAKEWIIVDHCLSSFKILTQISGQPLLRIQRHEKLPRLVNLHSLGHIQQGKFRNKEGYRHSKRWPLWARRCQEKDTRIHCCVPIKRKHTSKDGLIIIYTSSIKKKSSGQNIVLLRTAWCWKDEHRTLHSKGIGQKVFQV